MDITTSIPSPTLQAGQSFAVRYRAVGAGSWTNLSNKTNAPFTITGLSVGNYQLSARLVLADSSLCPEVIYPFTVSPQAFECIDFDVTMQQDGSIYFLRILYALPPGYTNPPCGYIFTVSDPIISNRIIPFSALNISGEMYITVPNVNTYIKIEADNCGGKYTTCFEGTIPKIATPTCMPVSIVGSKLYKVSGIWRLHIDYINSTPGTNSITVNYTQTGFLIPPALAHTGSFTTPNNPQPANTAQSVDITLTFPSNFESYLEYNWSFKDACGITHTGTAKATTPGP